jgi:hypothetical protein
MPIVWPPARRAKYKIEEQDPLSARLVSPGCGVVPPPTRPVLLTEWCAGRNGWIATRGWPSFKSPMVLQIRVVSRFSAGVSGGRIVGSRLASKVLPGRVAEHQDVMRAGGSDQERLIGIVLPVDVDEVLLGVRELAEDRVEVDRPGDDVELAGEEADGLGEAGDGDDVEVLEHGGLGGIGGGNSRPSRFSAAECSAMASMPLMGRVSPVRASSPTMAKEPGRSRATWPLPGSRPSAIGMSNPPASFFRSAGARFRWKSSGAPADTHLWVREMRVRLVSCSTTRNVSRSTNTSAATASRSHRALVSMG